MNNFINSVDGLTWTDLTVIIAIVIAVFGVVIYKAVSYKPSK